MRLKVDWFGWFIQNAFKRLKTTVWDGTMSMIIIPNTPNTFKICQMPFNIAFKWVFNLFF